MPDQPPDPSFGSAPGPAGRLARAMAAVGWGATSLAQHLDCSEGAVRGWYTGRFSVPEEALDWVEQVVAFIAANPPPKRPGRGTDHSRRRRIAQAMAAAEEGRAP